MPTVRINGFDLYYNEGGAGPTAVYVQGGFPCLESALLDLPKDGGDWAWEHDFSKHLHFVEYDRRGCYRSSCPENGYGILDQACDLEGLLDYLGVASAHLIGSSAGGPIATVFAATRPNRTTSLTLAGTAAALFPRGDPASEIVREHIDALERHGAEVAFDQRPAGIEASFSILWAVLEQIERGALNGYLATQRALSDQANRVARGRRVLYYGAELKSMKGYMDVDVAQYAGKVHAPTLVLHGARDRTVPVAWGEEMAGAIPGARFEVVPDASHTVVIRDADSRQRVVSFVKEIEGV